jgi:hypothetical protein
MNSPTRPVLEIERLAPYVRELIETEKASDPNALWRPQPAAKTRPVKGRRKDRK